MSSSPSGLLRSPLHLWVYRRCASTSAHHAFDTISLMAKLFQVGVHPKFQLRQLGLELFALTSHRH